MTEFASLIFLSFNRPERLFTAINTATSRAGFPHEIIVVDDGSALENQRRVSDVLSDSRAQVLFNPSGHNEGVGRSYNKGLALSKGDYVVKIDQDMVFFDGWLRKCVDVFNADPSVAMVGTFKYHVEPVKWQDKQLGAGYDHSRTPYHYVEDFVSSVAVTPREIHGLFGPWEEYSNAFAEDVAYKSLLRESGYLLALPDEDVARNDGFGVGPDRSTVVVDHGKVQPIHHGPIY